MHCALLLSQYVVLRVLNTDTCTVYADALCIVTLSVCCVTGTDNDTVTDINIMDTDTDTYTDTVDNDTEAARKLYFVNHLLHNAIIML